MEKLSPVPRLSLNGPVLFQANSEASIIPATCSWAVIVAQQGACLFMRWCTGGLSPVGIAPEYLSLHPRDPRARALQVS